MNSNLIIVGDKPEYIKFINYTLNSNKIAYSVLTENGKYSYNIDKNFSSKNQLICDLLQYFYKYEIIKNAYKTEPQNYEFFAYLGAILGLDFHQDRAKIIKILDKDEYYDVEGIKNFCMQELASNWESLASLSYRLYSQCTTEDEVYSLTMFILNVEEQAPSIIKIDNTDGVIGMSINEEPFGILPFCEDENINLILTIFCNNPSDIIINNPNSFNEKVIKIITKMAK